MNLPKQIRIGSVDYDVIIKDTPVVLEGQQCMGAINYMKNKIEIDASIISIQQAEITLLHEIMHGILYDRGFKETENEELVEGIARGLHQLIRDNKEMFIGGK